MSTVHLIGNYTENSLQRIARSDEAGNLAESKAVPKYKDRYN